MLVHAREVLIVLPRSRSLFYCELKSQSSSFSVSLGDLMMFVLLKHDAHFVFEAFYKCELL